MEGRKHLELVIGGLTGLSLVAAVFFGCLYAPTEETMGHAQRIVYVHVPVAWLGILGFIVMAVCGIGYLGTRDLTWDHWFQAASEAGWLCSSLTLATGSLWAREAWGTWWEWDPRLTTAFILWTIYGGILLARMGISEPQRRARVGAVLAVLGIADIPLVVMATRWFRGLHPVAPEMAPSMRIAMLLFLVTLTGFFVWLVRQRRVQVGQEHLIRQLENRLEATI